VTTSWPTLTLGCAQLGNLFEPMPDAQAQQVLQAAWRAGIRSFDTAPHYGLGLSEQRLGRFVESLSAEQRSEIRVSTKVGRHLRPVPLEPGATDRAAGFAVPATAVRVWDPTRGGVRTALLDSLTRLRLDRVDTAYVHDPDEHPGLLHSLTAAVDGLVALRQEGLVRCVGVGSKSVGALRLAVANGKVDTLMVAGRNTLLDNSAEASLFPECRNAGVFVASAGVFNSGVLSTPSPAGTFEYTPAPPTILAIARRLSEICRSHGTDLPTAALHHAARDRVVASVVVGARTARQVEENVRRWESPPPQELWADLKASGLLGAAVSA
jgi:D-threo-aldose 1-dehydrogenase